jgi:hypothetical protein
MTPSFFKKKGDFWGNLGGACRTENYQKKSPPFPRHAFNS